MGKSALDKNAVTCSVILRYLIFDGPSDQELLPSLQHESHTSKLLGMADYLTSL